MKAEIILGCYLGIQKAVIKAEQLVIESVKQVIVNIDKKQEKIKAKRIKDSIAYDKELNKVSNKYIHKGIKHDQASEALKARKTELQELL